MPATDQGRRATLPIAGFATWVVVVALVPPPWLWSLFVPLAVGFLLNAARWRSLLKRAAVAMPIVMVLAVGAAWMRSDALAAAVVASRGVLAVGGAVLFAELASPAATIAVLRKVGLPPLLAVALSLTLRFLSSLDAESRRLWQARSARRMKSPTLLAEWRERAGLIAQVAERASARAERVHRAMLARGLNADGPS